MALSVSTDQSKNIQLTYRKGEGKPFSFNFLLSSVAYNIAGFTFVFEIIDMDGNLILQLTEDDGLVNNGATGVLTINPSDDNVDIYAKAYWWKLRTIDPTKETWFNGIFIVNDEPQAATSADSLDVTLDTGDVVLSVELSIGGSGSMTGDEILDALTSGDIADLYERLLPYITGEQIP
jgi:hypothetical protein